MIYKILMRPVTGRPYMLNKAFASVLAIRIYLHNNKYNGSYSIYSITEAAILEKVA